MDNEIMKTGISMTTVEIAKQTGKRHDNVLNDTRKMFSETKRDPLSYKEIYKDSYGRNQECYILPKKETLLLISGYSMLLREKMLDRIEELETILYKGSGKLLSPEDRLKFELFAQAQVDSSEGAKLKVIHSAFKRYGIPTDNLPALPDSYEIKRLNESMDLFTATDLLKKFECTMATNTFNQKLYNMGYMHKEKRIEKHPRASNLDRIYGVRVLSGKGLRYGKNIEIGSHEGLHPRYYEDTFMELFGMVIK